MVTSDTRDQGTIVVVAYADDETVRGTLEAIGAARAILHEESQLVVVENTPLGCRDFLPPGTLRIRPRHNIGFAPAVMQAVRETRGEWVMVVNDDCVVEPTAITALVHALRDADDIGAVAGLLTFADNPDVVNVAGIEIDALGIARERYVGLSVSEVGPATEVFGPSAGFAIYRRRMLDETGGFDETFFAYLEDADLAWRARMQGWRTVFEPAARATHAHSASLGHASARKHYLVGRNRVRMLAKNATMEHLRRHAVRIIVYDLAYVAYAATCHRTLAPLRGRLAGMREWRRYRRTATRSPVPFVTMPGFRAAVARDRAYRAHTATGRPPGR